MMQKFTTIEPSLFAGDTQTKIAVEVLARMLEQYRRPSFGSIGKRDIDIMMFRAMQDLGLIDKNPETYEVVQALHVTSAKARNLIYASALSREQDFDVDKALKNALEKPRFLSGTDKMIGIEIDNPLLIDHLKYKLRGLGYITDGSFNQDLVRMTPEAMAALYKSYMPEEAHAQVLEALINAEVVEKKDDKKLTIEEGLTIFFKKLGEKVLDGATDVLLKNIKETLPKILLGSVTKALIAMLFV